MISFVLICFKLYVLLVGVILMLNWLCRVLPVQRSIFKDHKSVQTEKKGSLILEFVLRVKITFLVLI